MIRSDHGTSTYVLRLEDDQLLMNLCALSTRSGAALASNMGGFILSPRGRRALGLRRNWRLEHDGFCVEADITPTADGRKPATTPRLD